MNASLLFALNTLTQIVENDYAGFAMCNPHIAPPFLSISSFLDASGQLDEELTEDLAGLYLTAQRTHGVSLTTQQNGRATFTHRGFSARGTSEALYVSEVCGEERLTPGDRILTLMGQQPDEYRSKTLQMNRTVPFSDRDDWTALLKHARFLHVRHADGSEEKLTLRRFDTEPPKRQCCEILPGTALLYARADRLGEDAESAVWLARLRALLPGSSGLILDLRSMRSAETDSLSALLPCLSRDPISRRSFWGPYAPWVYYSDRNTDVWVANLEEAAQQEAALRPLAAELISEIRSRRGKGWVQEPTEEEEDVSEAPLSGPGRTVLLVDHGCSGEAEWFLRCAKGRPGLTLLGRESSGDEQFSHELRLSLGAGCTLRYPIGLSGQVRESGCVHGVATDVTVPWSAEECYRDVLLEKAVALLS